MSDMAYKCLKRLKYMRNTLSILEITEICRKWLITISLGITGMTQIRGNGLNMWGIGLNI